MAAGHLQAADLRAVAGEGDDRIFFSGNGSASLLFGRVDQVDVEVLAWDEP
jgi:hypothetical protein